MWCHGDLELLFLSPWIHSQSGMEEALPTLVSQASCTGAYPPLLLLRSTVHQEICRKGANALLHSCRKGANGLFQRALLCHPQRGCHWHLQDPQWLPSPSQQFGEDDRQTHHDFSFPYHVQRLLLLRFLLMIWNVSCFGPRYVTLQSLSTKAILCVKKLRNILLHVG
jgi:hypothetical protein